MGTKIKKDVVMDLLSNNISAMPSDYLQTTVVVAQTNAHGIFELKRQEQLQTSCFLLGENNR